MALEMQASQTDYSLGQDRSFELEIVLDSPGESDWINIPEKIKGIAVTVHFEGGGSGKVQTSTDLAYTVREGIPVPVDWPFGETSEDQTRYCRPCTGIRAVQINAGMMKMTLRAQ